MSVTYNWEMKPFLKAVFRITPLQVVVLAFFSLLKYLINKYNLADTLRQPMIYILLGAGLVFVIAVGVSGVFENKQALIEPERTRKKYAALEKRFSGVLNVGFGVPALIAVALFFYMIVPTTILMLLFLLIGIFLGNLVEYFKKKSASPGEI